MGIDAIQINGNQYDWGSIIIKIEGDDIYGVKGLKYSQKRERTKSYGAGKHHAPRGRSRGKYSAEGGITLHKSTAEELRAKLDDGTGNYGDKEFMVVAQYIEKDETPITVELFRCVIGNEDSSEEESPDPLMEELGLDIMWIKKNGRTLFDNSDGTR